MIFPEETATILGEVRGCVTCKKQDDKIAAGDAGEECGAQELAVKMDIK